jgi:hypothetical protein
MDEVGVVKTDQEIPNASLKLAAEGKINFEMEFEDKIYDKKDEFPVYCLLKELYDLEDAPKIFEKYNAKLDVD